MRDVFDTSSKDSASDTGALSDPALPAARPKCPSKRGTRKEYRAWTCKTKIDCDLFHDESTDGLTLEEKTYFLKEHLRTSLQHDLPRAMLACAALVDSNVYSGPPARLSIPITFYLPKFRPKKSQRFLWKRGTATEAFGRMCPADCMGTPSSTPTCANPRHGRFSKYS
jgi:hypothetical protein